MDVVPNELVVWFGAMLLDRGHVVQCPKDLNVVNVRTRKGVRKIALSMRDAIVSRTEGRVIVGKISELQEVPDAIAMICTGEMSTRAISILPVASTKSAWISEGRHYTVSADKLVDLDRLDAYLTAQGIPD